MERGNGVTRHSEKKDSDGGFETILLAVEQGDVERTTGLVGGLVAAFGATVQVLELPEPHGLTRSSRDHRLALATAEEAERLGADLIVLGADRAKVGRHHLAGSMRQQLSARTGRPVMVAPVSEPTLRQAAAPLPAVDDGVLPARWNRRFQHV